MRFKVNATVNWANGQETDYAVTTGSLNEAYQRIVDGVDGWTSMVITIVPVGSESWAPVRREDLKVGDIVVVDAGFSCMDAGSEHVVWEDDGDLFIYCREGKHFLGNGTLSGIRKAQ